MENEEMILDEEVEEVVIEDEGETDEVEIVDNVVENVEPEERDPLVLEEDMLVRANNGIWKIWEIEKHTNREDSKYYVRRIDRVEGVYEYNVVYEKDVIKNSYNIMEVIEDGDYVNGAEVIGREVDNFDVEYLQCGVGDYIACTYYEEDIDSVVTKEEFKRVGYVTKELEEPVYEYGDK